MSRTAKRLITLLSGGGAPAPYVPTQSLGAELITNPDMNWAAGVPTGWTLAGGSVGADPGFFEVASGGGAGTGAVRIYKSASGLARLEQTVATVGNYYETVIDDSYVNGGRLDPIYTGTATFLVPSTTAARVLRGISRAAATSISLQIGSSFPHEHVINSVSMKRLTVNTELTAASADMDVSMLYTLPASPLAGDAIWLLGRISSFSSGNYWLVLLEYTGTQWNITLYSVASHTRTSQKSATNVGTTNGIRFYANANTIRMYTTADGGDNWTQRGTDLTSATYNTATGVNVLATSAFTLGELAFLA